MSTNIKVIRYTAIMSGILAILTYLISLNIAFEWFDWNWFSNSFMLTIFGGAFASMLVVLICEIQKYIQNKRLSEDVLFAHVGHIYAHLYVIETNLKRQLENEKETVFKELIRNNLENLKQEIEIIRNIDYTRFSKNNKFVLRNKEFGKWLMTDFSQFVSEGAYLAIAVNTDQIGNMIATGSQGNVTATSPYTSVVMTKLIKRTADMLSIVDDYGKFIDDLCKNRYVWELKKLSVEKAVDIEFADIDDYIKEK